MSFVSRSLHAPLKLLLVEGNSTQILLIQVALHSTYPPHQLHSWVVRRQRSSRSARRRPPRHHHPIVQPKQQASWPSEHRFFCPHSRPALEALGQGCHRDCNWPAPHLSCPPSEWSRSLAQPPLSTPDSTRLSLTWAHPITIRRPDTGPSAASQHPHPARSSASDFVTVCVMFSLLFFFYTDVLADLHAFGLGRW